MDSNSGSGLVLVLIRSCCEYYFKMQDHNRLKVVEGLWLVCSPVFKTLFGTLALRRHTIKMPFNPVLREYDHQPVK